MVLGLEPGGNTNLTEKEMGFILDSIREVTSAEVSTYTAIKMSGYSKSQFYQLVKDGLLPKGYHVQRFKEIRYNKWELEKALKKLESAMK